MKDNIVDARGMLCPQPLILTKKAFGTLARVRPEDLNR